MANPHINKVDGTTRKANLRLAWIIGLVALIGLAAPFWALKELAG
ncbi:MAG: hypothetical protein QGG88_04470 [Gammaproteobacteria bacterium]|jgi:hypothetical protein|nr:hypothetical protein [Gammaproteobacteria bacterium]